jgi:hypothetical protein
VLEATREQILERLRAAPELLTRIGLLGPSGRMEARRRKKLEEIAGFSALILRRLGECFPDGGATVLECSCGKSYLSLVLSWLLRAETGRPFFFIGVDFNPRLVEASARAAEELGLGDVAFECSRTIAFDPGERRFDVVCALHACDTATDEAIAKGLELGVRLILTVPCCQNQIRGQLRSGHALEAMSQFGPVRYHLANLLTDTLRALYMHAAGYHVEMDEITSPRVTPKNLCLMARKVRRPSGRDRSEAYRELRDFFGVRPAIERLWPQVAQAHEAE